MDITQENTLQLSERVDTLHQMLEQINDKVTNLLSHQGTYDHSGGAQFGVSPPHPARAYNGGGLTYDHKDILNDEPHFDVEQFGHGQTLSPEVQIQRLTAQLTAAYNRIAALEEQLLTHRSH
jgi:uncharacterized coiled-coil protein SlyX